MRQRKKWEIDVQFGWLLGLGIGYDHETGTVLVMAPFMCMIIERHEVTEEQDDQQQQEGK